MTSPSYSKHDEYIAVTRAQFPRGAIWFDLDEDGGAKDLTLRAIAKDPARISEAIEQWVEDHMLDTLSPDAATTWERFMRLDATGLTIEQRRAQVIVKWRGYGTPTLARVQSAADVWGLNAVVRELVYALFRMGMSFMGDPLRGDVWAVALEITYDGPRSAAFETAMLASVQATTEINFIVR